MRLAELAHIGRDRAASGRSPEGAGAVTTSRVPPAVLPDAGATLVITAGRVAATAAAAAAEVVSSPPARAATASPAPSTRSLTTTPQHLKHAAHATALTAPS